MWHRILPLSGVRSTAPRAYPPFNYLLARSPIGRRSFTYALPHPPSRPPPTLRSELRALAMSDWTVLLALGSAWYMWFDMLRTQWYADLDQWTPEFREEWDSERIAQRKFKGDAERDLKVVARETPRAG